MNVDQKYLETEFSIAICRPTGDKWQSTTLFVATFDPHASAVKSVFDCRLSGRCGNGGVTIQDPTRVCLASVYCVSGFPYFERCQNPFYLFIIQLMHLINISLISHIYVHEK